ncbi:MAG: hypothetical protein JSS81_24705 [Acidobacteria bacterium]|nr:hypothetical protein [Acidobacteriota bacterium]
MKKKSRKKKPAAKPLRLADVRESFGDMIRDLHTTIDEFDDEELIRLGCDADPYQNIVRLVETRDGLFAVKHNIPPEDDPDGAIADFNEAIDAAWRRLGEKWDAAVSRFPELAESLRDEPGNIRIEEDRTPFQIEVEELSANIAEARQFYNKLAAQFEAEPGNAEVAALMLELDDAFATGNRRISALTARNFRQFLIDVDGQLRDELDELDEQELVRSGLETTPAQHILQYANLVQQSADAFMNLHPDDNPQQLLNLFERTIAEARRRFKAKRAAAEARYPKLRREYPMDDDYQKALADLLEAIAARDELADSLKFATPADRPEGLRLLRDLDAKIEASEAALAAEYEAEQNRGRALDALRDEIKFASAAELRELRKYLKDNPEEMKDFQRLLADEFPDLD